MSACTARIEADGVLLPKDACWLDEFRSELLAFPLGIHDDQVETRKKSNYTLDNL